MKAVFDENLDGRLKSKSASVFSFYFFQKLFFLISFFFACPFFLSLDIFSVKCVCLSVRLMASPAN